MRDPLPAERGEPRRGVGTSGEAGGGLGTGPLFTKPGKTRVLRLSPRLLHHREGGKALPVLDAVVAEALAGGAELLRPSLPGSRSPLPLQRAAPLALGLVAADGLNPWRDLKMNHAGTHQTVSPLPETLFPACSASISAQEETSLFACKM